jgi:hypothetical protein
MVYMHFSVFISLLLTESSENSDVLPYTYIPYVPVPSPPPPHPTRQSFNEVLGALLHEMGTVLL